MILFNIKYISTHSKNQPFNSTPFQHSHGRAFNISIGIRRSFQSSDGI